MNPMKRAAGFVAILALLASAACSSLPPAKWYEVPARGFKEEDLHEKCLLTLQLAGFKVAKSDVATGRIESQWEVNLVPFYRPRGEGGAGFRRRAILEIDPVDDPNDPLAKRVRLRVERERNSEKDRPGDPKSAKWEPDADDARKAQELAVVLNERVSPFEPSEDFRRRYGLQKEGSGDPSSKPKNP
jgi:hypothetical protein